MSHCFSLFLFLLHSNFFFFFNDTSTTEIYTLSYTTLFRSIGSLEVIATPGHTPGHIALLDTRDRSLRSEEHTSELQSRVDLVCRLLLEKKKKKQKLGARLEKDQYLITYNVVKTDRALCIV